MKIRLVQLYKCGVRRQRDELRADPGLVGLLTVRDWPAGNAEGRPLKMAEIHDLEPLSINYPARQVEVPLFDVVLLRVTAKGMLLRGFQIDSSNGPRISAVQEWWCEIIERGEGAAPPSKRNPADLART